MPDEQALEVKVDCFEWLEGFENRAEDSGLTWFYGLDLKMLTVRMGTLELYVTLNLTVGPRSTMAIRIATDSTFYTMVGEAAATGDAARCRGSHRHRRG